MRKLLILLALVPLLSYGQGTREIAIVLGNEFARQTMGFVKAEPNKEVYSALVTLPNWYYEERLTTDVNTVMQQYNDVILDYPDWKYDSGNGYEAVYVWYTLPSARMKIQVIYIIQRGAKYIAINVKYSGYQN